MSGQAYAPYRILSIHKLGGQGGWDYLAANASTRELYIARSGPTGALHVYYLDTLKPITTIPTGTVHGAAIDNATHHGFAAGNDKHNTVILRTSEGKLLTTLPIGAGCDGALFNPATQEA